MPLASPVFLGDAGVGVIFVDGGGMLDTRNFARQSWLAGAVGSMRLLPA